MTLPNKNILNPVQQPANMDASDNFSCKILLVEDSDIDAGIFKKICDRADGRFDVDWVPSAEEAYAQIGRNPQIFDVIVSDVGLPGMSGLELFTLLQKEHPQLPLIVLTGAGSEGIAVDALRLGASNYCRKDSDDSYQKILPFVIRQAVMKMRNQLALEAAGQALQEQIQRVELADRAKVQFMHNISHELRTPLNCVVGFSDALKRGICGELEGKVKDYVSDINSAGQHLGALIDELLAIADIESGNIKPAAEAVCVEKIVSEAVKKILPAACTREQIVNVSLPTDMPKTFLDPRHLRQIILNILNNSVLYSHKKAEITVTATVADRIIVSLQDNGPGIPKDNQVTIFEPFSRSKDSLLSAAGGMGLGLSIVKALAVENDIAVKLISDSKTGTRIDLSLPLHQES